MADYYFQAKGLSVGYGKETVLEQLTFEMNRGEILTLIGPNGSGKSTLLKSIRRQLSPMAGTVYLEGKDLSEVSSPELAKKMASVFTERLHGELMTCGEVVAYGRYPYTGQFGMLTVEDHRIVREAMELVKAAELRDREFDKISDGQRQRVLLAGAICQEPEILLLDEPTSYLDIKYKLEFLSALQKMTREKNLCVILSLHELELAQRISDRLLCVGENGVEAFGTPDEIFTPGSIGGLFGIDSGSFDEESSSPELEKPSGKPEVFVLAGAGSGRNIYRRLQRQGIPFATGILFENDLDYPVARALAAEVVSVAAFQKISQEKLERAQQLMNRCEKVVVCREQFGEWEQENRLLREAARQKMQR